MTVVVFCGPTIGADAVVRELDATVLPPARRGDLLHAALGRPDAIVLIDGYFDRTPSVWHKEILWAMSQGVHVFGSSSMGAIRAAELASFGMVGVGDIFEAFASGELEDDDEVAVSHGDAESGYRLGSEAMVNLRATLRAAEAQAVIDSATRHSLEAEAKALPYHERHLQRVLVSHEAKFGLSEQISMFRRWLPQGRVDQKLIDATSLLKCVAGLALQGWQPKRVDYQLAHTDGWRTLVDRVERRGRVASAGPIEPQLEDELLARGLLGPTLAAALVRLLAEKRMQHGGVELGARAVEAVVEEFRRERQLLSTSSFDAWIGAAELSQLELEGFFRREAVVRATRTELRRFVGRAAEDELRAAGSLTALRAAAGRKASVLEQHDVSAPSLSEAGLSEEELWAWHFHNRLGVDVPESLSLYAASQASSLDELRSAVLRDYIFVHRHQSVDRPQVP